MLIFIYYIHSYVTNILTFAVQSCHIVTKYWIYSFQTKFLKISEIQWKWEMRSLKEIEVNSYYGAKFSLSFVGNYKKPLK